MREPLFALYSRKRGAGILKRVRLLLIGAIMQKYYYSEKTQQKMRSKFGSHDRLYGKAAHRFPESAEREYIRLMHSYMRQVKKVIEGELPTLMNQYKIEYEDYKAVHTDGFFDFKAFLDRFFDGMKDKLDSMDAFGKIIKHLRKIGVITKKHEISEWKRMVHKTLGVNLSEDYYNGEFFESELAQWVSDNVDLISTIPKDMLERMKQIIYEGYQNGASAKDIAREIQDAYGMGKTHAEFIARDQMSKLSADITRKEHEDAGVTKYEWSDSGDERVRESHRRLNGRVFSYNNPPETDGGRHCNPGEDYNCRCVAIPVFEEDLLNLALEDEDNAI